MNGDGAADRGGDPFREAPGVWRAIAGFVVWAAAFVVLYAGHALGCLHAPADMPSFAVSAVLWVLWAAHLAAGAALAWHGGTRLRRLTRDGDPHGQARFMWRVTFLADVSALGAVFVTGLPLLVFPACVS